MFSSVCMCVCARACTFLKADLCWSTQSSKWDQSAAHEGHTPTRDARKIFSLFSHNRNFSHQQISFLVAPVAWQFLILHEQMTDYR